MTDDHRDDTSIRDFNNWADTAARTSRNSTHRRSGTAKYAATSSNASSIKKKSSITSLHLCLNCIATTAVRLKQLGILLTTRRVGLLIDLEV